MKSMIFAALCASVSFAAESAAAPIPVTVTPAAVVPVIAMPKPVATVGSSLPANTEIWLAPNAEVNSKLMKQGEKFDMTVMRDVMLGDYIVIPRGTKGHGQISYRSGKGAFGKSGKMEFEISEIQLGEQFVPLTGHYRIEGQGNTGATVGAVVAVGVFSAFVTGHSAVVAQGTEYKAFTVNALPIALGTTPQTAAAPSAASAAVAPPAVATAAPAAVYDAPKASAELPKT